MITLSNQIELRHLKYFLVVAEELHFRKAAERLFISQPGLSRQIKQLEEDLDVTLFYRDNRNVSLSEAGKYLQKSLTANLEELRFIFSNTVRIDKGLEGNLNIGYVGSAMQNIIPELMVELREGQQNIHFNLEEMNNQDQLDSLVSKELDLGFVRLDRVPIGLELKPLFEDTFSLVLPGDHFLNDDNFLGLSQLQNEHFIMFDASYSPTYYQKIMQIFEHYDVNPMIAHKTVHASSIYKLVELGFGISIVPSSMQLENSAKIKFIKMADIPQRTTLSVVWNKSNRNPLMSKIMEYL